MKVHPQLNAPSGIKNNHEVADMPPHAVCVFDGDRFNVYQWHQEMFDGSTLVFERVSRRDGASVLAVTADKKILIVYEEQPNRAAFVTLPHGGIEPREDPLSAAQRELEEETGYISNSWSEWFSQKGSDKVNDTLYVFIARNVRKVAEPTLDAGEKVRVEEVSFEEFCDIVMRDDFRTKPFSLKVATMLAQGKKEELRTLLLG